MDRKTKIWIGLAVVVVAVLVGWSAFRKGPANADVVKIGVLAPVSGDIGAYGQEVQRIVNYEIKKINSQNGTKLEVVLEDSKCSGSDAVNAFQKLTDVDGVKVVIGGLCSSETLGVAPLTKDGKAVVISYGSSNPDIEGASPYVFSLSYSDQVIGQTLAREMGQYERVAIISEQNDFNIGIKKVWEAALASNVRVVASETVPKGSTDFRNTLAKIRQANPQAILLNPNPGVTAQNLLKQLAEMKDWKGYTLYSQIAYLADNTRTAVGSFAEGMVVVDAPNLTDPKFLAYKSDIEKNEGPLPTLGNYYTASTLDDLDIVASLVRELGNDPKAIRSALVSRTFHGFLGDIRFDGHSFKQGSVGAVYVVRNGKAEARQ